MAILAGGSLDRLAKTINPRNVELSSSGTSVVKVLVPKILERMRLMLDKDRSRKIARTLTRIICQKILLKLSFASSHVPMVSRRRFDSPLATMLRVRLKTKVKMMGYLSGLASDSKVMFLIFLGRIRDEAIALYVD